MKSAAVFALDVSCTNPAAFEQARQVCLQTVLDKMLYAPNDELGLVLCGTDATVNPLSSADPTGTRYKHLTVAHEINKVSNAFLEPLLALDASRPEQGKCDVLEALTLCAYLLHAKTAKKKYSRRLYLLTQAKDEVAHKSEITTVLESLRSEGVSVVVVGIDFTQEAANVQGSWEGLGTKAENERVLHYLCDALEESDGTSAVVSLEDSLQGLQELRRRKVLQRGLAKLVLTIGDVKLATQMYSKIVPEKVPPLKKVTRDGAEVGQQVDYVRVGDTAANQGQPQPQEDQPQPRSARVDEWVRALHYGRSLIPCTDADVEAMKIKGPRGLEGVGFAHQREIPPYILTGSVKTLLPLPGDAAGQRGFSCLVEAMLRLKMVLIVRYVSRTDAKPALGVCLPALKAKTGQLVLYYAPLPFTEDVRLYRFSEYADVSCTATEEALMESLVNDMTVDGRTLRPSATFNPEVHQYYATVRAKILEAVKGSLGHSSEGAYLSSEGSGVPELLPQLQRTSAAFTSHGNALEPLLRRVQPKLESCATAFPYVESDPDALDGLPGTGAGQRNAWFNAPAAALHSGAAAALQDDGASSGAPTTVAAPALVANRFSFTSLNAAPAHSKDGAGSEAPSGVSTVAATAGLSSGKTDRVSSIDPVGSFRSIVEAARHDPNARALAMDGLADVMFDFLRHSIKESLYDKCDDCVRALREHCVAEEEPAYFNTFLSKLQATAQELELGETYWTAHIVKGTGTHPITRKECASSTIADDKAAAAFMSHNRALPAVDLDEDIEDDVMDLIV